MAGPSVRYVRRRSREAPGASLWAPATQSRYVDDFSKLSSTPSRFMNGLLGIHMTPPERAVVPPTRSVFSSMRTRLPAARISRPAHMEPPPLPTTTKSKTSSNTLIRAASGTQVAVEFLVHVQDELLLIGRKPRVLNPTRVQPLLNPRDIAQILARDEEHLFRIPDVSDMLDR